MADEEKQDWSPADQNNSEEQGSQEGSQEVPQSAPQAAPQAEPQPAAPAPIQSQTQVQTQEPSFETVSYQKGCVGAAWGDIRGSKGWFGKVALMGLVEIIPILNWFNAGYAMRWGRDLFFGRVGEMPSSIFADRGFANGAMCFVLQLVATIIGLIVALFLGFVPVLGLILGCISSILIGVYLNLMVMRTAIFDEVGAGFGISQVVNVAKGHFGSLFAIWLLPCLITGLIGFGLCTFVLTINSIFVGADITNYFTTLALQYGGDEQALYSALSTNATLARATALLTLKYFAILTPGILISFYIICICSVLSQLLAIRAAGHFCARWATEWKDDPRYDYVVSRERI